MELTIKYIDGKNKDFVVAYYEGDKDEHKTIMFYDWIPTAPKVSFTKIYGNELIIFTDMPCQIKKVNEFVYIDNKEVK
jgi:hypothetical protein